MKYFNNSFRLSVTALLVLVFSLSAQAREKSVCIKPQQVGVQSPDFQFPQPLSEDTFTLNENYFYLCNQEFIVGYSSTSKTPMWSAEHLTKERISKSECLIDQMDFM